MADKPKLTERRTPLLALNKTVCSVLCITLPHWNLSWILNIFELEKAKQKTIQINANDST